MVFTKDGCKVRTYSSAYSSRFYKNLSENYVEGKPTTKTFSTF
jgi:hypothetical protein